MSITKTRPTSASGLGAALWALVATLLARFAIVFADVEALDPPSRRAAGLWLRDLEALARRLLFAQAVRLAAGVTFARRARRASPTPPQRAALRIDHRPPVFKLALCAPQGRQQRARPPVAPQPPHGFRLARRASALTALLADPAAQARKLARRIARRRELVPLMLLHLRRYRAHRRLRRVLGPLFADPPENLIGSMERPPPRAGPYAITLTPDLGALLAPEPRTRARRGRASARANTSEAMPRARSSRDRRAS